MTLTDFFRYLATDRRTSGLSLQLADAYRLQSAPPAPPRPHITSTR